MTVLNEKKYFLNFDYFIACINNCIFNDRKR